MNTGIRSTYIACSSIFFFMITVVIYLMVRPGYDESFSKVCIVTAILMIVMQGINSFKIRKDKSWFQIDLLFLLMFFFVHFWLWASVSLNLIETSELPPNYLKRVNFSLALSLLGMSAFILGYNIKPRIRATILRNVTGRKNWLKIGYVIFYLGAALTLSYAFYFGVEAFQGKYVGSDVGSLAARTVYLLQSILLKLGILIILIAKADSKRYIPAAKVPIAVLGAVLAMLLVLGDRSEFIYTLATVMFGYSAFYRRISLPLLIAGTLTIALLMSAAQIARRADDRSLSEISKAVSSGDQSVSIQGGLQNISASGGVLLAAVTAVPKEHDYFMGELKTLELLGIIPFGRSLFMQNAGKREYVNSATFLTWYILGPNATSGAGSTIIADIYVDFGPTGVVIGMFFLGYLACLMRSKSETSQSFMYAVTFCYFAGLLVLLPRYSLLMVIRGLIWPFIFLWLVRVFFIGSSRPQPTIRSRSNEHQ